jgi:hypothetical protein
MIPYALLTYRDSCQLHVRITRTCKEDAAIRAVSDSLLANSEESLAPLALNMTKFDALSPLLEFRVSVPHLVEKLTDDPYSPIVAYRWAVRSPS